MYLFELLKALFFGIIEGVTEWLPISSTGHLILVQDFVMFKEVDKSFIELFNVFIQLGAILSVVVIYFNRLNPFRVGRTALSIRRTWQLWAKVLVAILPVIVIGLPLDHWFEKHFHHLVPVALMLILYGWIFIVLERRHQKDSVVTDLVALPYKTSFFIGLFQVLSLFPGTSRSGATIVGGMVNGASRQVATEFTFFLGIPVMLGASLLKVTKFILAGNMMTFGQFGLLLTATLSAFVVSLFVIRFLVRYVKQHSFVVFGTYRMVLGVILLIYAAIKMATS